MSYIIDRERYGRTEKAVDLKALAIDLARELGGKVIAERYTDPQDVRGIFAMPDGLEVMLYTAHTQPTRVVIHAGAPQAWTRFLTTRNSFPECTVAGDRPLSAIAKDVMRKVISPSDAPLLQMRQSFQQWTDLTERAKAMAAELSAKYPGVDFWLGDRRVSPHENQGPTNRVNFNCYRNGASFSGYLMVDGGVTFERLGATQAQGLDILAQLAPKPNT